MRRGKNSKIEIREADKRDLREALPEDFNFILKLTRQNMERIVTEEWNADWEKDIEPDFINAWKTQGEKKIIEEDNRCVGYFWFE